MKDTYKSTAWWKQPGFKSSGKASALHLVAFRDDIDEVYAFEKIIVSYKKMPAEKEKQSDQSA